MKKRIILASASPRRKELLKTIIDSFEIVPSNIKEDYPKNLNPLEVSLFISNLKAYDIHSKYPNDIVIGCDTTVIINDLVLGKPSDKNDAKNMLKLLSNNCHYVVSSVTIYDRNDKYQINSINKVYFKKLSDDDINNYLENDEYKDKAGSYAIQGLASKFIYKIEGEYESIVGLPIKELNLLLNKIT